jgi:type IV secretion system protein VirB10
VAERTLASPDGLQLRGVPLASARLSKKAALTAVAVLAIILGVIIVNVSKESPKKAADTAANKELQPALGAAQTLTRDIPDVVAQPPPTLRAPVLERTPAQTPRKDRAEDARLAETAVPKFVKSESTATDPAVAGWSAQSPSQTDASENNNGMSGATIGGTNGAGVGSGNPLRRVGNFPGAAEGADDPDLNHQDEKIAFQRTNRKSAYLGSRLTAPVSPYELKTGTVIPGVLIGAMNSDLPGEIIAQVSQNVYDTSSGNHLLIPQGTRLYGHYDSNVSFGQGRLLVSWDRLIFPNAYTLELEGMSGHDQGGGAGYADRVNNHYGRIFGWALLTSVLSAGAQLSQPQQSSLLATQSSGQIAAAAVGQQLATLGTQIAQRNLQVQPTIEIRKGYRMIVMVNKDIVFPGVYEP